MGDSGGPDRKSSTAMEKYNGYWISGTAKLSDFRFSKCGVAGEVYRQGPAAPSSSYDFEFPSCKLKDKHLAELF